MPSRTALGTVTRQGPRVAHILRVGEERVGLPGWIADQDIDPAHPPVEPRSAAEAADHRYLDGLRHDGAGDRTGMAEVDHDGAGGFELLRQRDQLFRRALVAVHLGEYRNADFSYHVGRSEDLHHVRTRLPGNSHR